MTSSHKTGPAKTGRPHGARENLTPPEVCPPSGPGTADSSSFNVLANRYFALLLDRQYRVSVLDTTYLKLCPEAQGTHITCRRYGFHELGGLSDLERPVPEKITALFSSFVTRYARYQRGVVAYNSRIRPILVAQGIPVPRIPLILSGLCIAYAGIRSMQWRCWTN
jgi:hypothetical protein